MVVAIGFTSVGIVSGDAPSSHPVITAPTDAPAVIIPPLRHQTIRLFNEPISVAPRLPVAPVSVPTVPKLMVPPRRPVELKREAFKAAAPPVPMPGSNTSIDVVIAFALSQQGKPYVWGASGPHAYDCSGLVLVAFSKIGIQLPHFTGAMLGKGKPVSKAQLQRGDIVFPQSGHVGIYLGGGKYIDAPHSGTVVRIDNLYGFYAARRLVGA